jgi:hypothetical protein
MDKASAETRHGDFLPVKLSTHAFDFHSARPGFLRTGVLFSVPFVISLTALTL